VPRASPGTDCPTQGHTGDGESWTAQPVGQGRSAPMHCGVLGGHQPEYCQAGWSAASLGMLLAPQQRWRVLSKQEQLRGEWRGPNAQISRDGRNTKLLPKKSHSPAPCTHPSDILLTPRPCPPLCEPALLQVPPCSPSLRPRLRRTASPVALLPVPAPSAACSEEASQELSAGGAAPGHWQGHWQGDEAQLAVEAQLLPVSGTDPAKHSPRPWKGGERLGPLHWKPSAGAGGWDRLCKGVSLSTALWLWVLA